MKSINITSKTSMQIFFIFRISPFHVSIENDLKSRKLQVANFKSLLKLYIQLFDKNNVLRLL